MTEFGFATTRGYVGIGKTRRQFLAYMRGKGFEYYLIRRETFRTTSPRSRRTRRVAVFKCGCRLQVEAYPIHGSAPIPCDRHKGAIGG